MARVALSQLEQAEQLQISPEWVRLSAAAAISLGLKAGRTFRDAVCHCANLLQTYPEGCYANCSYCGLARERPGVPVDNTFIRVAWPLYPTDVVAQAIAAHEDRVGRVCIAQVQDNRAYHDLLDMQRRVRAKSDVPISALVSATVLDEDKLAHIKEAGADIIGVGLDGASEEVFYWTRGKGARGPHDWDYHWQIVEHARHIFGPMKVNCHMVVGLGESDRDLIDLFYKLKSMQVAGYLFSFNPEPGTQMQNVPRAPPHRWRRIQLIKYLIEQHDLPRELMEFDAAGSLLWLHVREPFLHSVIAEGQAFMTNGCPDKHGEVACNRPYGSYRPGEEFRDYPFVPTDDDLRMVQQQMRIEDVLTG
jgi:biotin synthase